MLPGGIARRLVVLGAAATAAVALALVISTALASGDAGKPDRLTGRLMSGRRPIGLTPVTLYVASRSYRGSAVALGSSHSGPDGSFSIAYRAPRGRDSVLYVIAGQGSAVRLASVLGAGRIPSSVVVNERTTVAAGFAFAQFIDGHNIAGPAPGPRNAAAMAANLVNARTGGLGRVVTTRPNGTQTPTLRTVNSLSNMLVPCVRTLARCPQLFALTRPPGGRAQLGTLETVADIARNPGHNVGKLFALSRSGPVPYRPALRASARPDAWVLALRFYGNGKTLSGPGNSAVDADGNVWVAANYTWSSNPAAEVCGSKLLFKFLPSGRYAPGSPYSGGGVNGAGFGVAIDLHRRIWVGNFGFAAHKCADPPPHNSLSLFTPSGKPLSPNATSKSGGGFTAGKVSWPQGVVSDRHSNIWAANCGNNTVTVYPKGDPRAAKSLKSLGLQKPFDLAFNTHGQAFVTGNGNNAVAIVNPDGKLARPLITQGGLNKPLGIAADTHGNMWVANSSIVNVPCPKGAIQFHAHGSVTFISSDGKTVKNLTGGGMTAPWGTAVDGNDNVWIANFTGKRVSELCGTSPRNCPPGVRTGQPISPAGGYGFPGLTRNTSVQIDPSGNLWVTNNWKIKARPLRNPGGYEMVVYVGAAKPVRTPLIGPPRPL
jgi:hypothetical protein